MVELADGTTNAGAIWAAAIAGAAALVAAVLSAWFTYLVTARTVRAASEDAEKSRNHARDLARDEHLHHRDMASIERGQARMFDAYLLIARYVEDCRRVVAYTIDQGRFQTDPPRSEPKRDEIDIALEAQVSLVGSAEVQQLLRDFNRKVTSYRFAIGHAESLKDNMPYSPPGAVEDARIARNKADASGLEALNAGTRLIDQMRADLAEFSMPLPSVAPALSRPQQAGEETLDMPAEP